jgi:D-alanyl-D-alanine dipeptidase
MGAAVRISLPSVLVGCVLLVVATGAVAQSRHPGFVDVAEIVPDIKVEIRYAGNDNFVGRRIDGYEASICLLTRQAALALAAVQRDLAASGLGIKTLDCYRPARAVAQFVRWARDVADQTGKAQYFPDIDKRTLFRDGYISARSGHSRGSTVDLTLVRLVDGQELDMGSAYDFFGPRSWTSARDVSDDARANRRLLVAAMRRRGFVSYFKEWWHFTLASEPYPDSYFDFPVN